MQLWSRKENWEERDETSLSDSILLSSIKRGVEDTEVKVWTPTYSADQKKTTYGGMSAAPCFRLTQSFKSVTPMV